MILFRVSTANDVPGWGTVAVFGISQDMKNAFEIRQKWINAINEAASNATSNLAEAMEECSILLVKNRDS